MPLKPSSCCQSVSLFGCWLLSVLTCWLHQTVTFYKIPCNKSKFVQETTSLRSWGECGLRIKMKNKRLILICSDLELYQVYTFLCWQGADNCISHTMRGHPIRGQYLLFITTNHKHVSGLPHFILQTMSGLPFRFLSPGLIRQSPISSLAPSEELLTLIVKWSHCDDC